MTRSVSCEIIFVDQYKKTLPVVPTAGLVNVVGNLIFGRSDRPSRG